MRTLGDTQRGQSEILAQHTVLHEETGSKLDQLLIEINAVKHTCP